jgi:hypothetical protein
MEMGTGCSGDPSGIRSVARADGGRVEGLPIHASEALTSKAAYLVGPTGLVTLLLRLHVLPTASGWPSSDCSRAPKHRSGMGLVMGGPKPNSWLPLATPSAPSWQRSCWNRGRTYEPFKN